MFHRLIFLLIGVLPLATQAQNGQTLSLDTCLKKAAENYPLVQQYGLIQKSAEYSLSNASKAYLPQFQIMGQVTYQSDVPNIPTGVPGVTKPLLDKDQYKTYAELNQSIYDGGLTRNQKNIVEAQSKIDRSKIEIDLYALRDRVTQLYFGILIIDKQLSQNKIYQNDIENGLKRVQAMVAQGAALKSNEDVLQADLLKSKQRDIELNSIKRAYLNMLGAFLNQTLDNNTQLEMPPALVLPNEISRPELNLFEAQKRLFESQRGLLAARNMPKLSLFAQGGYAKPGFDFFKNEFVWYYIGGVRLSWNVNGFYTLSNEKKMLDLNARMVDVQQETFLFNTRYALSMQETETEKYRELLKTDDEIVQLRKSIKERAAAQLQNGTIQASDYMREVNAEDLARQNQLLHQIQFLQTQYNQKISRGK